MKKILLLNVLAIVAIVATFLFSSCSKTSTTSTSPVVKEKTTQEKLLGTWVPVQTATDNNMNGTISDNEIMTPNPNDVITYTYTDDGKMTYYGSIQSPYAFDTTIVYSWELQNNDQDIFLSAAYNDTATVHITKLSDTEFEYNSTIYANSTPVKGWAKLKKK